MPQKCPIPKRFIQLLLADFGMVQRSRFKGSRLGSWKPTSSKPGTVNVEPIEPCPDFRRSLENSRPVLVLIILLFLIGFPGSVSAKDRQGTKSSPVRSATVTLLPDESFYGTLRYYIQHATQRIEIAMFIFKTTKSKHNRPEAILEELIRAHKRGVSILVVLEESGHDEGLTKENRHSGNKLQKNGIEVVFDAPKTTTHAKMVVIDRRYIFIGSHNLTQAALSTNNEISILIDQQDLAAEASRYINNLKK